MYIWHTWYIIAVGDYPKGGKDMADEKPKKINLSLDADPVAWVSFAAGLRDTSQTAYINDAIRRDRDGANEDTAKAFQAFLKAREG